MRQQKAIIGVGRAPCMGLLYVICIHRGPRKGSQHPRTRVIIYGAIPIALHPARTCPHFCPSSFLLFVGLQRGRLARGGWGVGVARRSQGCEFTPPRRGKRNAAIAQLFFAGPSPNDLDVIGASTVAAAMSGKTRLHECPQLQFRRSFVKRS